MFCCIGNYSVNNSAVDMYLCSLVGVLGYVLVKLECEPALLISATRSGPSWRSTCGARCCPRAATRACSSRALDLAFVIGTVLVLAVMLAPTVRGKCGIG
jgi:TctA family transporter